MTSKTYVSGTVIDSAWLNDVNDTVYAAPAAPVGSFKEALSTSSGASLVGYMPDGVGAVPKSVQSKLRERVSVFDFMTEVQIADVIAGTRLYDASDSIQAAINYVVSKFGGTVFFPNGTYGVGKSFSIHTTAGVCLEGESWISTIIYPLDSTPTFSPHNAIITVDYQPWNGSISNLRFKTSNFTGWVINGGPSTTGKNMFSVALSRLWIDLSSTSQGFFYGGMYDCFVDNCQFENVRYGFSLEGSSGSGNRNLISNINWLDSRNSFIKTNGATSYMFALTNIAIGSQVGNALLASRNYFLDVEGADGWTISNISYDSGNATFDPATSYSGFIKLTNCIDIAIDNCTLMVPNFGTSNCLGFELAGSSVTVANTRFKEYAPLRTSQMFNISGASNVKVTGCTCKGSQALTQIELSGALSGKVEFNDCVFEKAANRIVNETASSNTADIRFKNCTLIDPHWGKSFVNSNYYFVIATSGATEFIGNTIGRSAEGEAADMSALGAIFRLVGTGTGLIEANVVQRYPLANWNYISVGQRVPANIVLANPALASGGTIVLPGRTSGIATVQCGDESAIFAFSSTAGIITKLVGTANTATTDTAGNLCAFWAGANTLPTIKNYLAGASSVTINYQFL